MYMGSEIKYILLTHIDDTLPTNNTAPKQSGVERNVSNSGRFSDRCKVSFKACIGIYWARRGENYFNSIGMSENSGTTPKQMIWEFLLFT